MFTGLIAGMGSIEFVQPQGQETRLGVKALFDLPAIVLGESIAVNGVCLTVEQGASNRFSAYASAETLNNTSLGSLRTGDRVNLERALAVGERLGGHIVSGHVDCVATVSAIRLAGESRIIRIRVPHEASREIVAKGSVALDGISLTVNDCGAEYLEVNVIPETWRVTTVAGWRAGSRINLETDCIAKYVRHMLGPYLPGQQAGQGSKPDISLALLQEHGFL